MTPHLADLHVFAWVAAGIDDRHALPTANALGSGARAGRSRRRRPPRPPYALCEYVRGDDPEQFIADVRTLRRWLDASEIPDP